MDQAEQQLTQLWNIQVGAICDLGEVYYRLGRIDVAWRVLRSGISTLDAADATPADARARLLLALGRLLAQGLFLYGHELEPALPLLAEASGIATALGDDQLTAALLNASGLVHYYQAMHSGGEYAAAQHDFEQALALRRQQGDQQALSETLFHAGLVAERRHDGGAKDYYAEALELAQRSGAKLEESYASRHLAFQASMQGEREKAIQLFAHSLQLRQELGYETLLPLSYLALAEAYDAKGVSEKSRENLDLALAKALALNLPVPLALVLLGSGDFNSKQGDKDAARSDYTRAASAAATAGVAWLQDLIATSVSELDRQDS